MKVRDAVARVKKGKGSQQIVLCGEDPYIRAVGIEQLADAVGAAYPEMNVASFEGRPDVNTLVSALGKVPFMSERKVVILRETDILGTGASADLSKPLIRAQLDPSTVFIISAPGKLDRRKGYVKYLLEHALVVECEPLQGDALATFIVKEAAKRGLAMGKRIAEDLADRMHGDLYALTNELDKLACVLTGQITAADIDRYSPRSDESNMFAILDLFMAGRWNAAYGELETLLAVETLPVSFLSFLFNSFHQMLVARACRNARFSQDRTVQCICEETGARPWAARKSYERCAHFSVDRLRRNVRMLADMDFGMKQGEYIPKTDMFGLVAKLFEREKTG